MGLLDEAIREHLELKRRRGADPEEIAKQEHDALGPVRREPELPPPAAEEPAVQAEEASRPLVESVPDEPLTPPAPAPAAAETGHSTEEWSFEDDEEETHVLPPEPAETAQPHEEAEDVLEETPDFLQETPEHDRLWFEQKPPRDFDFDG